MFTDEARRGFDFLIKTKELRTRLLMRARFHAGRAAFYRKKGGEFKEDLEAIPQSYENSTLGRHEDQLARSRMIHIRQERVLRFFADHLPQAEMLHLTPKDLEVMELLEPVE